MRRALGYILRGLLGLVLVLLVAVGALAVTLATGAGRQALVRLAGDLASSPGFTLSIGGLEGEGPSDFALTDIALGDDRPEPWLTLDHVRIAWHPLALLSHRLDIAALDMGRLRIARLPAGEAGAPEPDAAADAPFSWPQLPVEISLGEARLDRLDLAAPVAGYPAALSARMSGALTGDGAKLDADLSRLDGVGGALKAQLAFDAVSAALSAHLDAAEPAGGVIAGLVGVPGTPALTARIEGEGPLTAWQGTLAVAAGPDLTLEGSAHIGGSDVENLTADLRLSGRVAALAPPAVAPLADGPVSLALKGGYKSGDVELADLALSSPAAALTGKGSLSADGTLAFNGHLALSDPARWQAIGVPLGWQVFGADVSAGGTLAAPEWQLTASLEGADLSPVDPALTPLVGDKASLMAAGRYDGASQALELRSAELKAAVGTVELTGDLHLANGTANASAKVDLADLSLLAPLTPGLKPKGSGHLTLDAARDSSGSLLGMAHLALDKPALGIPAADGLLGDKAELSFQVAGMPTLPLTISDLSLTAAGLKASGNAHVADDALSGEFTASLPDLKRLGSALGLAGAVEAKLVASGSLAAPAVMLDTKVTGLASAGQPLGNGSLSASARRQEDGRLAVSDLKLSLAGLAASGSAMIDITGAAPLTDGKLEVRLANAAALGKLLRQPLGGVGRLGITLAAQGGHQSATAGLDLRSVSTGPDQLAIQKVTGTARLTDLFGKGTADVSFAAQGVTAGTARLTQVTAGASGALLRPDWQLSATLEEPQKASLEASGTASLAGGTTAVTLAALDLKSGKRTVSLQKPATLTLAPQLALTPLALKAPGLMVTAEAARSKAGDLSGRLVADAADFRWLGLVPGAPQVKGKAHVDFALAGSARAPEATLAVTGKGLGMQALTEAGLAGLDLNLSSRWAGGQLTAHAAVGPEGAPETLVADAGFGLPADASGLPAFDPAAALTASLKAGVDLAIFNDALAASASTAGGRLDAALTVGGTLGAPDIRGTADLVEAKFESPVTGVPYSHINGHLVGRGNTLTVERFSVATPKGGKMSLGGDISFGGRSGPVFNLVQKADKAQAAALDTADVVVSSDITLKGPLSDLLLAGTVTVDSANIGIPERLPPSVTVINYRVKGAPPPEVDETGAATSDGPSVRLGLALEAPNKVFVRGRGLDVELGGKIDIRGTADNPEMNGAFKLQRGTLDLFGQTYNFTSGTITFEPDSLEPTLDLVASLKATDATVTITVAGKPSSPSITLSSSPTLSQDEILARLVFGKPLSDLNGYESVQLARSAATLAGFGGGTDIVGSLRQTFGLDRLSVSGTGGDDISVDAGRYINDRVYLGVEQGLAEDSTGAKVEIKLTDTLSAESSVNATSGANVGLTFEMDY